MTFSRKFGTALLLVLAMLAVACGSDDDSSSERPASNTDSGSTSEDSDGGSSDEADLDLNASLTVVNSTIITDLDPHTQTFQSLPIENLALIYDRLFTINPEGELAGFLVTDWEYSADGMTLTMSLRDDVEFRDGSALDAEVVKLNLDRARTLPETTVKFIDTVESVEVVDEYTVALNLNTATSALPFVLSEQGGFIMHPDLIESGDPASEANGSGPYVLESFIGNEKMVLQRDADHYWDPEAGKVATVTFEGIRDFTAQTNALRGGQVQVLGGIPVQAGEALVAAGFNEELFASSPAVITFNQGYEPLDDLRVRQAIAHAIDREAYTEVTYPGSEVKWSNFPVDSPYASPDAVEQYGFDPDKAKSLLADAGHADGLDLGKMIVTASMPAGGSEIIQQMLADVGIKVALDPLDPAGQTAAVPLAEHSMVLTTNTVSSNPGVFLSTIWPKKDVPNAFHVSGTTPEYDLLLEEASKNTLSDDEAAEAYQAVDQYTVDNAWGVPLTHTKRAAYFGDKIVGVDASIMDYATLSFPLDFRYVGVLK